MVEAKAGAREKISISDNVELKVIKAGDLSGYTLCGICSKDIAFQNYPEGKKPICKKCMQEIYEAVKEAGGHLK